MSGRRRKFLGGVAILVFLVFYSWAAVAIGERLPDHWAVKLVYFLVAGLGWGVPIIPLMSWMHAADRPS